jgi:chemotaxis signal transduction protein
LRAAFDRAFAEPFRLDAPASESLLAIRAGNEPFALRLAEIAGLFADRKISHVPGNMPALLGLAGFRGALVPVYSLQVLLAHAAARAAAGVPRWIVLAAAAPVAFAFEVLEGQLRVSPEAILPEAILPEASAPEAVLPEASAIPGGRVKEFVRAAHFAGPILHLPSLFDGIGAPGGGPPSREASANR